MSEAFHVTALLIIALGGVLFFFLTVAGLGASMTWTDLKSFDWPAVIIGGGLLIGLVAFVRKIERLARSRT